MDDGEKIKKDPFLSFTLIRTPSLSLISEAPPLPPRGSLLLDLSKGEGGTE